jgi:hypothetical protein
MIRASLEATACRAAMPAFKASSSARSYRQETPRLVLGNGSGCGRTGVAVDGE